MIDVNCVLNDESCNDKKLVKELSLFLNYHKKNISTINKRFVKDMVNIILNNYEVNFSKIILENNCDNLGDWEPSDMTLSFNLTLMMNEAKILKNYLLNTNVGDNRIYIYFSILNIVIHEITHARQYYINNIFNNQIYDSCIELINENYDIYRRNHSNILIERYAYLRGYTIAYDVLSYIYPINKIQEIRKLIFAKLFNGYYINNNGILTSFGNYCELYNSSQVISALDSYNKIMNDNSLSPVYIEVPINQTNLFDRLYLGLNISLSEYQKIFNIYKDIYNGIEKKESVKKLINK